MWFVGVSVSLGVSFEVSKARDGPNLFLPVSFLWMRCLSTHILCSIIQNNPTILRRPSVLSILPIGLQVFKYISPEGNVSHSNQDTPQTNLISQ